MSTENQWRVVGVRNGAPWKGMWESGEPSKRCLWDARQYAKRGSTDVRIQRRTVTYSEITEEVVTDD